MSRQAIKELFIEGYYLLSDEAQRTFEQTDIGQSFCETIDQICKAMEEETQQSFWSKITNYAMGYPKLENKSLFQQAKTHFLLLAYQNHTYQALVLDITFACLLKANPDFQWLDTPQKTALCATPMCNTYAQQWIDQSYRLDSTRERLPELIDCQKRLLDAQNTTENRQLSELQTDILSQLQKDNTFLSYLNALKKKKRQAQHKQLEETLQKLAQSFPFLNHPYSNKKSPLERILHYYKNEPVKGDQDVSLDKAKQHIKGILKAWFLTRVSQPLLDLNLSAFYEKEATALVEVMFNSLSEDRIELMKRFLLAHQQKLSKQLQKKLLLEKSITIPSAAKDETMTSALSYLWDNRLVNDTKVFVKKIAQAHAFIQATGFSTQNESSLMAVLDIVNYARLYDQINENSTMLSNVLSPLMPIYNEYKEIGLYENNIVNRFVRAMIPIVITVGVIVAIAVLIAPLGLPELAFAAVFIPALLLGLGLTAAFLSVKNTVIQSARQAYYGGVYEIPEFQINERLEAAFQSKERAAAIRQLYIHELQVCDTKDEAFRSKLKRNCLTETERQTREAFLERRRRLCLEWFDLHSNTELGIDKLPRIASKTIQEVLEKEYGVLKQEVTANDKNINDEAQQIAEDVLETAMLKTHPYPKASTWPLVHGPVFFKPHGCMLQREKVMKIQTLHQEVSGLKMAF